MTTEVGVASAPGAELVLPRTLRWQHVFALCVPGGVVPAFMTAGFVVGSLGTWGYVMIMGVIAVTVVFQNLIFAEMAGMFPDKPGGVALYSMEAWKSRFTLAGPLAAFGYWAGWALAVGITGVSIGYLVQAQWFASQTWGWKMPIGGVVIGLPHLIAIGVVILGWVLNYVGIGITTKITGWLGIAFVAFLAVLLVGTFAGIGGSFHVSNLTWSVSLSDGGWKLVIVWFYVMLWSASGSESAAAFVPEYKNPVSDTVRGLFTIVTAVAALLILIPVGAAGYLGEAALADNPLTYAVQALQQILTPSIAGIAVAVLVAFMIVGMFQAIADSSRALYGMSQDGITIKQFHSLNRFGMPGRALTLCMVVNVLIVVFVGSVLGILLASNLGYILSFVFAIVGFVLLRRDRPDWPRPFKLKSGIWIPIAIVVAAFELVMIVIGLLNPSLAGYGGLKETIIAIVILAVGVVAYIYRVVGQDHAPLRMKESSSTASPASSSHGATPGD
jgi:amino acid transporter